MANDLTRTRPSRRRDRGRQTPALAARRRLPADDLGTVDRAFLMSMARVPFIAVAWVAASYVAYQRLGGRSARPTLPNFGPLVVLCFGMLLAAWIDGYAFKVPNWLTLSLVGERLVPRPPPRPRRARSTAARAASGTPCSAPRSDSRPSSRPCSSAAWARAT